MSVKVLTAIIHKEENIYLAECPEVGTVVSQGYSLDDALNNLREATELYLEDFPIHESGKTIMTTFEAAVNT